VALVGESLQGHGQVVHPSTDIGVIALEPEIAQALQAT
jgi:hypothetical protein